MALEDAYKQIDSLENVTKMLKDEVGFLKGELEQGSKFQQKRDKDVDLLEADRREKDVERKYTQLLNDKDRQLINVTQEMERYKNKNLE